MSVEKPVWHTSFMDVIKRKLLAEIQDPIFVIKIICSNCYKSQVTWTLGADDTDSNRLMAPEMICCMRVLRIRQIIKLTRWH